MKDKIKKIVPTKVKLEELSQSPVQAENEMYNTMIVAYFGDLLKILDIKTQSLTKGIRARNTIISEIAPKLLEFVPELSKPQFIKFFKSTFRDFNLEVTPEDISDVMFAVKRFDTRRDDIVGKKYGNKKDVELLDNILEFIEEIKNEKLDDEIVEKLYDYVYKFKPDYDNKDTIDMKHIKIGKLFDEISDFTSKTIGDMNFTEFYNDKIISRLLDFIDKNLHAKHFVSFRNKSFGNILLRMGFNIKTNVSLKDLFKDVDTEIMIANKKRILAIFVELYTQIYYPNAMRTGVTSIEKEINKEFLQKDEFEDEMFGKINGKNVGITRDEENLSRQDQEILQHSRDNEVELKQATSKIKPDVRHIDINNVNTLYYDGYEIPVSESRALIEFVVPSDRKFTRLNPPKTMYYNDKIIDSLDFNVMWETGQIEKDETNWIKYLEANGLSATDYLRYSIPKEYIPIKSEIVGSDRQVQQKEEHLVEVMIQLLVIKDDKFVEVRPEDVDYSKTDVKLPQVEILVTPQKIKSVIEDLMKQK